MRICFRKILTIRSNINEFTPKALLQAQFEKYVHEKPSYLEESNRANISHHCQRNKQIAKANLQIDVRYLVKYGERLSHLFKPVFRSNQSRDFIMNWPNHMSQVPSNSFLIPKKHRSIEEFLDSLSQIILGCLITP